MAKDPLDREGAMSIAGATSSKRRKPVDYYKWAAGIGVPIIIAVIGLYKPGSGGERTTPSGFTYVGQMSVIENQYQQYLGQPLKDEATKAQIQSALNLAAAGQYDASRRLFEQLAGALPLPAIFTSVGSLYAEQGNIRAAREFYDKAVAKDPSYKLALKDLKALDSVKAEGPHAAAGHEVEPNNDIPHANIAPLGTAVLSDISAPADTDFFRYTTGHTPRDRYRISIKNLSTTLSPGIRIYDEQKNLLTQGYDSNAVRDTAGADLDYDQSPPPDATYYIEVYPRGNTTGPYSLTVVPQHTYDRFEPNDDIPSAKPLMLGTAIEANIMDPQDTDFFQVR